MRTRTRIAAGSRRGGALWWILGAIVAIAGVGIVLWATGKPTASAEDKRATADRVVIKRDSFDIITTAGGDLEAKNKMELRNPMDRQSTIVQIVAEGTRVKKDEVVVQLNADEIQQQVEEETARVESARADVVRSENEFKIQENENESRTRQVKLKVEMAELALSKWLEGEVAMKRQENSLKINRASLELERLADKFAKSQELLDQGFVSKDETDRDEVSYIEAISNYTTAGLAAEVYERYEFPKDMRGRQSDVDEARAEQLRVALTCESELASKSANRANQQKQLAIHEQRLAKLKQQVEAAVIKAPQEGLVVYATSIDRMNWGRGGGDTLQIGQQVWPNQLLIVLPDTSEMVASVRVQEALAGRIKQGMKGTIKVEAAGGKTFPGTVESISVLAESGGWRDPNLREYTVKLALEGTEPQDQLKPAMRVEARLVLGSVSDALTVPVQAVFQEGPVRFVYLDQSGRFAKVPVKLGRRSDTLAELAAGAEEGQTVLLREPKPGEVLAGTWEKARLELAGYKVGEDGQPVAEENGGHAGGMRREGGPRGGPGGPRQGEKKEGAGPQATQPGGSAPAAAPATPKAAPTK